MGEERWAELRAGVRHATLCMTRRTAHSSASHAPFADARI